MPVGARVRIRDLYARALAATLLVAMAGGCTGAVEQARKEGYEQGHADGFEEGKEEGHEEGKSEALDCVKEQEGRAEDAAEACE